MKLLTYLVLEVMRQRNNGRKLLDVILDVLCLISAVCLNESNMPHQYMLYKLLFKLTLFISIHPL